MKKYEGMPSLDGHKILLKAMNECGVKRLVDWATPSVPFEKDKKSFVTVVPGILAGIAASITERTVRFLIPPSA